MALHGSFWGGLWCPLLARRQSGRMGSFVYGSRGGDWSAKNSHVKPCVVEFRRLLTDLHRILGATGRIRPVRSAKQHGHWSSTTSGTRNLS